MRPQLARPVRFEIWGKVVSPARDMRRGQVVRPKLDQLDMGLFSWDCKVYPARVLRKGWLFCRPAPISLLPYGIHSSPFGSRTRGPRRASAYLSTHISTRWRGGRVGAGCSRASASRPNAL